MANLKLAALLMAASINVYAAPIDTAAANEAIAHGTRYASSNGMRLGKQSIQSQQAANNVTNSMNAFNSAPAANRSVAAQAVADAQNAQAAVNAAASNSAHQVATNSASVSAASAAISANTATVNPIGAGKHVSGYAPQPGAYSVPTPSPKAPTQTKAPVAPHTTTVVNTTSAAAGMAALTAGKMASSVAPVGKAPNTMDQGTKVNPAGNPVNNVAPAGVKTNPAGNPVNQVAGTKVNPAGTPVAISSKPANSSINIAAGSLKPSTPVKVGNTLTTAGDIAKTNPNTQISVPVESVFNKPSQSNHSDRDHASSHEHGTGNGSSNAQASRSAGGFSTAGSHIGGGRSGGGFHY